MALGTVVKGVGTYLPTFPAIKTAGYAVHTLGAVAKPICGVFEHLYTLNKVYNSVKYYLDKFGINVLPSFP